MKAFCSAIAMVGLVVQAIAAPTAGVELQVEYVSIDC